MGRPRAPPFLGFAAVSLALHAAAFTAIGRGDTTTRPAFDERSASIAGETLDVDPPAIASPDDEPPNVATPSPAGVTTRRRSARLRTAASATPNAAVPPALFGAVGVRFATDLATTFTRAFPQAASADRIWSSVPFGSAGRADVTLVLDKDGRLARSGIDGSPSSALRGSIERTLVLLGTRDFTARGAVTRLRMTARVSRDDVHDGLHGDVFALSAGSFSGDVGSAFFALPPAGGPGRRVDVEIRLLP
ncbi:MAG: hypothetical protein WBY94_22555 [Polyangiaceae bacterium]